MPSDKLTKRELQKLPVVDVLNQPIRAGSRVVYNKSGALARGEVESAEIVSGTRFYAQVLLKHRITVREDGTRHLSVVANNQGIMVID